MIPPLIIWLASFLGGPDRPPCPAPAPVVTCESQLADCREEFGKAKVCFFAYKQCVYRRLGAK